MQKFVILWLSIFFSFFSFASSEQCQNLDKKIDDIHLLQGNVKMNEKDTVSDYVEQIEFFSYALALFENLHTSLMARTGSFDIEKYLSSHFSGVENPTQNETILKYMSLFSSSCSSLKTAAENESCSDSLMGFRNKKKYNEALHNIKSAQSKLTTDLQLAYDKPEFRQMSLINKYLATEKLKHCPDEHSSTDNSNSNCPVVQNSQLDELAINSLDAIGKYLVDEYQYSESDVKKACTSLLNSGFSPLACSGVACQKNFEFVAGECRKICSELEIRSSKSPYGCYPDEKAQITKNQRIQKRKAGWGKVLRTTSIIAVAGGAVAGTAYLLHEIYKDKSLITVVDHQYTYKVKTTYNNENNYKTYNTTNNSSSTPNTSFYNYNPYSSYFMNPYSQMSYPNYQYGYNPYYYQSGGGYPYNSYSPYYGNGLGSGAWGAGYGSGYSGTGFAF